MEKAVFWLLILCGLVCEASIVEDVAKPVSYFKDVVSRYSEAQKNSLAKGDWNSAKAETLRLEKELDIAKDLYSRGLMYPKDFETFKLNYYHAKQKVFIAQYKYEYSNFRLLLYDIQIEKAKSGNVDLKQLETVFLNITNAQCQSWYHQYAIAKKDYSSYQVWLAWIRKRVVEGYKSERELEIAEQKMKEANNKLLAHHKTVKNCLERNIKPENFDENFFVEKPKPPMLVQEGVALIRRKSK